MKKAKSSSFSQKRRGFIERLDGRWLGVFWFVGLILIALLSLSTLLSFPDPTERSGHLQSAFTPESNSQEGSDQMVLKRKNGHSESPRALEFIKDPSAGQRQSSETDLPLPTVSEDMSVSTVQTKVALDDQYSSVLHSESESIAESWNLESRMGKRAAGEAELARRSFSDRTLAEQTLQRSLFIAQDAL